jgi:hypothetical protein
MRGMSGCGCGRRSERGSLSTRRASLVSRAMENGVMPVPGALEPRGETRQRAVHGAFQ